MTDEEHLNTQQQVMLVVTILRGLDLVGFKNRLDLGYLVAMIVRPPLYRESSRMGRLSLLTDVTDALISTQQDIHLAETRFRERRGDDPRMCTLDLAGAELRLSDVHHFLTTEKGSEATRAAIHPRSARPQLLLCLTTIGKVVLDESGEVPEDEIWFNDGRTIVGKIVGIGSED